MAVTESNYTVSNSSTTNYSFTFPYLKTTDVKLSINGVASSAFTFANATTIQLNSNPTVGDKLRIYRETDDSKLEAEFFAGSAIKSSDLNDNFNQNLYVTQESNNKIDAAWTSGDETIDSTETWASNNTRVATTGAIDGRIDSKIDTALTTDVAAGNKITVTDNSPGSGQITIGVTSGSLVNSDINASAAIAGTKVSPDFGSQNVATTGTLASGAATITGNIVVSGTISDAGGNLELNDNVEISGTLDVDGTATLDDATVDGVLDVNGSSTIDNVRIDGNEIDTTSGNLTIDSNGGTVTVDDNLTVNGTVDLDNITGDAVITSGTSTSDTKVYSAKRCDELYYNLASGEEIQSGETWSAADNKIATTAAIDARIVDLVDDVGGFVPIANETSFPNANPDVNNGAGTLVSVPLANNLTSNGSGVISISNGTVGNSTVTITGAANSTTYTQGFGIIVETTSTLNTYTFHRYVPKATEVTTVAGNISNINTVAGNNANISTVAGISGNVTTVAGIAANVTAVAGDATDIGTVAGAIANVNNVGNSIANVNTTAGSIANVNTTAAAIANVNTVAGIASNVTTVAGDTTAINNITTNLSAVQNAATNATNAASSATAAASSATSAATSATTATTQATTATTQASNAATSATNAATSATSSASSATTATSQASTATTQATNSANSASTANTYQDLARQYRDAASGILTQTKSIAYNLVDSVSSHTAWGSITDGETADFADENSNTFLTMAEGSATYNYGSIT